MLSKNNDRDKTYNENKRIVLALITDSPRWKKACLRFVIVTNLRYTGGAV